MELSENSMQNSLEITSIEQLRSVNQDHQIQTIKINNERITCEDARLILKMTQLGTLSIFYMHNNTYEKGAIVIIAEIIKLNKHIQEISISMNEATPAKIISLMPSIKCLTKLRLFCCNQNCIGDIEIEFISNILSSVRSLDLFSMANNNIGISGADAIVKIIKNNPYLRNLILDNNCLGNEGARIIGPSISSLTHLEYLSVRSNKIRSEGAEAIYQSIVPNDVVINLEENLIPPKKLDELKQLLNLSPRSMFPKR